MSAGDALSPSQFGMHVVDSLPERDVFATPTRQRVSLANVHTDQDMLRADVMAHYRTGTRKQFSPYKKRPEATLGEGGRVNLYDGNHRVAAAKERGQKRMTMDVLPHWKG